MNEQEAKDTGLKKAWPLGGAKRESPPRSLCKRLWEAICKWMKNAVSNLRMSLTLRIALHFVGQLLKTTLPMLLALLLAICLAQMPSISDAMDALSAMKPANGNAYTDDQLLRSPFVRAEQVNAFENGWRGWIQRGKLLFSEIQNAEDRRLLFYVDTADGGVAAAWPAAELLHTLTIAGCAFVLIDLYRILFFLRGRNRLNRKVLKPVADMARQAAALSANNLSDRLSVDGAKNELKDLALVINDMLDRIEVSYNSQKQFVSDASHELRTPIAVIQGYISMLERWGKTDKEVLDEGIAAISQEAASMKELVERLLFLARHDKKTLMLEMEHFDPLEVMSEIHREARMLSANHNFKLDPAQNGAVYGDKDMIKQLMRILLDNAIKYTPEGGNITLGSRQEGRNCVLTVSDTGAGISAEELPKVFERFYRCDSARKSSTSGHGLGLSIARIIVSAHGGKLRVRSKVGVGTTFMVLLPSEHS